MSSIMRCQHKTFSLLLFTLLAIVSQILLISANQEKVKVPPKPSRRQFAAQEPTREVYTNQQDDDFDDNEQPELTLGDVQRQSYSSHSTTSSQTSHTTKTTMKAVPEPVADPSMVSMAKQRPVVHFQLINKKTPMEDSVKAPAAEPADKKSGALKKGSRFFKDTMKSAYKSTKKYVKEASDSLALMKAKARLGLALDEANDDSKSVRKEYSLFTVTLSPVIESALNYVGSRNLNYLQQDREDPLDFRSEALHALAFAYEFMRLLGAWRESMLPVHEAYKHYLLTLRESLVDGEQVTDGLFVQLRTIHNYLLLTAWVSYDELSKEPREKLEYLMSKVNTDATKKDFERTYLRQVLSLSKIFEQTRDKFNSERQQVIDSLAAVGAQSDAFPDVDEFFDGFRDALDAGQLPDVEWRVPREMEKFLLTLEPELRLNPLIYDKHFLWRLNKGL